MLYFFEHLGVAVCAISGVLAAGGKRLDLFGVIVLALVTALGGGTLRDGILEGAPVFWLADTNYVLTAVLTALITFFVARYWEMPAKFLLIADAFGLALFTVLGAQKALSFQVGSLNAVVFGVMTGVAGGIMRDVLTGEIPLVFRKEIYLYATASLCGAAVFVLLAAQYPAASANIFIGSGITLFLRLAAIRWRISLPLFKSRTLPGVRCDTE